MEVERMRVPLQNIGPAHQYSLDPSPYAAPVVSFDPLRKNRLRMQALPIDRRRSPASRRGTRPGVRSGSGLEDGSSASDNEPGRALHKEKATDPLSKHANEASSSEWGPTESADFKRELERRTGNVKSNKSPRDTLWGEVVTPPDAEYDSDEDVPRMRTRRERIYTQRLTRKRDIQQEIAALEAERRQLRQERLLEEQGNPGYRDAREYMRNSRRREEARRPRRPAYTASRLDNSPSPPRPLPLPTREAPRANEREEIIIRERLSDSPIPQMRRAETMPYPRHGRHDAPFRYNLEATGAQRRGRERLGGYNDVVDIDGSPPPRVRRKESYYVTPSRGRAPPGAKKLYSVTDGEAQVVGETAARPFRLSNWSAAMPVISSTISQDQTKSPEDQQRALLKRVLI